MTVKLSLWQSLITALRLYVIPIQRAVEEGPNGIAKLLGKSDSTAETQLRDLASATSDISDVLFKEVNSRDQVLHLLGSFFSTFKNFADNLDKEISAVLWDNLTLEFLWNSSPRAYTVFVAHGIIDETRSPKERLDWAKLKYLWQPQQMMINEYGWGTANFDGNTFLERVANIALAFGGEVSFQAPSESAIQMSGSPSDVRLPPSVLLALLVQHITEDGASASIGFEAMPISGVANSSDGGFAVTPVMSADFPDGTIGGGWSIGSKVSGEISHAAVFRPSGVYVEKLANAKDSLRMDVSINRDGSNPWKLDLGEGFQIQTESVRLTLGGEFSQRSSFDAKFDVQGFEISLLPSKGDGFLSTILPSNGVRGRSDFSIEWWPDTGFQFSGSAGLGTSLPLHLKLGPVVITELGLGLRIIDGPVFSLQATLDIRAKLGPITTTISKIGVNGDFSFINQSDLNRNDISLGPLGIDISFLPPDGVGLTVKAGGVTGGGYLLFDRANHLYSGALQLEFAKLGLAAIGFITTGGPEGYSLVININAKFTPPIQLSFGFRLTAVGGLIAINRTMSIEPLQAGILDGTLDSLLFPSNPVTQAPTIIQNLQRVLPAQDNRYVVGPMVRITWGAKSLIKADLGIFFEFPSPVRMLLAGQLDAAVPHADKALIEFHVAVLGFLDLGRKVLSIDARVKEGSHIVGFKVLGDMALRLSWGEKPYFLMAMGGFHPRFPLPAVYPPFIQPIRRLTLIFDTLKSFHLSCESYFAITSNSIQFGAQVDLYVKVTKRLKVEGYFGYDTLIIFSPFYFDVEIRAGVAVKWKKRTLLGVNLTFAFSGPRAWRAKGKGKIKILFIKISIGFNKSWGKKESVTLPGVNPLEIVEQALRTPDSWGSQLPPQQLVGDSLDPFERLLAASGSDNTNGETSDPSLLVMDPAGTLEIRQKEVPLGIRLDTVRNSPVTDANRVIIDQVTIGEQVYVAPSSMSEPTKEAFTPVQEHFAPCQFVACSQSDRLTKPAFELMDAGVAITSGAVASQFKEAASLEYESLVIDEDLTVVRGKQQPALVMEQGVSFWTRNNAASRAGRSLRPFQAAPGKSRRRVRVVPRNYHVVKTEAFQPLSAEELRPYRVGPTQVMTRLEADQVLEALNRKYPDRKGQYHVLAATEVGS